MPHSLCVEGCTERTLGCDGEQGTARDPQRLPQAWGGRPRPLAQREAGAAGGWGGGTLLRVMLAWALFRSTPGLPPPLASSTRPHSPPSSDGRSCLQKGKPFTGCEQAPEWAAGDGQTALNSESRGQLACHHGDRHQALRAGSENEARMVPRAPSGGHDPTPSPQPSFPRSAEPDQQESLGSAESRFAPGAPCLLIKGKKERKKEAAENPEAWHGDFV